MPSKPRPSTANTMMLVLKPRPEEYTTTAPLAGSENEREAWRKNRVIQMKLGSYLAEVHLQQRSSARLLKTEEYRFRQEVHRMSGVPRSVSMLQKLQIFRQKTFPGASHSHEEDQSRPGSYHLHKHPPLSARGPFRTPPQSNLLDRPKTSATIYRKHFRSENFDEDEAEESDGPAAKRPETFLENNWGYQEGSGAEQIFELSADGKSSRPSWKQPQGELPAIRCRDNKENQPIRANDGQPDAEDSSRQEQWKPGKQFVSGSSSSRRSLAVTKTNSLSRLASLGQFSSSDLPLQEEAMREKDAASLSNGSFPPEPRIPTFLADEPRPFENNENFQQSQETRGDQNLELETTTMAPMQYEDLFPEEDQSVIVDAFDPPPVIEQPIRNRTPHKRISKSLPRAVNHYKPKAEPVLRHNITSVLRQERLRQEQSRFEASQTKIKDYLHKMSTRDVLSRPSRDSTSAHSRRSSLKPDLKIEKTGGKRLHP